MTNAISLSIADLRQCFSSAKTCSREGPFLFGRVLATAAGRARKIWRQPRDRLTIGPR